MLISRAHSMTIASLWQGSRSNATDHRGQDVLHDGSRRFQVTVQAPTGECDGCRRESSVGGLWRKRGTMVSRERDEREA